MSETPDIPPWGKVEHLSKYYKSCLDAYLGSYLQGQERMHIADFSAAVAAFNDAWWAIFQEFPVNFEE
jgi:hypothetical protein